ncbi:MAG: non-ribosomal peptide synthetase [Planctomycetes bacterium]|nr:non-ribosomal peptide synthetase [Planctomycetota bacterium]
MSAELLFDQSLDVSPTFVGSTPASLAARIAAHALATPNRVALTDEHGELTFAQLEQRSNQWAWRLIEEGVKTDGCVSLLFDRSIDFVVAALAVMKSGAAYLPMDSAVPTDRAMTMLNDAGATIVLTHRRKTSAWSAGGWCVLEVEHLADAPSVPVQMTPAADSLAYIVYTSGSTGVPKGVEITHANLLNLIDWHSRAFGVSSRDRASQVAGLGFDATAWEVWPHLAAGATVHIADEVTRRSPAALRDWILAQQITISFVPTVLAEQLMHSQWPANTLFRLLLTGADVLHRRPVEGLPFTVVNNYGPSECTVVATSGIVSPDANCCAAPSIGRPIDGCCVFLLDEHLQPVKKGEAGELCIGGVLVGRGYHNRPELTESRFVMYQPESGPAVRVYRTGDRARYLANGEIAFMGRLDDQMKIRGYRIEPGEIVANLDRVPGVEASAVAAIDTDAGPTLVAYLVLDGATKLNATDLRDYLAPRLPDYMIPQQFVRVDALPLTANGKLNRAALPTPTAENTLAHRATAEAPTIDNDLETQIAALVAGLLDQPTVSPTDNFFLLGGHSMLAAQLVARVGDMFGTRITLRQLFNAPTAATLAAEIRRMQENARG